MYDAALLEISAANLLAGPGELDSFKLSLASKEASPVIQAFYSHYDSQASSLVPEKFAGCWVLGPKGEAFTDVRMLRKHLAEDDQECEDDDDCGQSRWERPVETGACRSELSLSSPRLPFDHVWSESQAGQPRMRAYILYADVLHPSFNEFHSLLLSQRHSITYILRWRPAESFTSRPLYLSGYGASLDIKKSDYLAIDDRALEDNESTSAATTEAINAETSSTTEASNASSMRPLTRLEVASELQVIIIWTD